MNPKQDQTVKSLYLQIFEELEQCIKNGVFKPGDQTVSYTHLDVYKRQRVDSSLLACKLKREYGINSIPHMTCRDRNINATKALLLGLNIEGVNNVLLVTGDPIPSNQREEIKGMTGFNSARLAEYVTNLNETVFSPPFNICGALNINSNNFAGQISHCLLYTSRCV